MNENKVADVAEFSKSCNSDDLYSSEMDYSLLASDLQKLLSISPKGQTHKKKVPASEVKKGRTRNYSYLEDIDVLKCPLCPSTFNTKDLLAKHALRIHHKATVNLLQDGSTQQHLKCRFCVHKVMHRHQKLLLLHLEKKHAVEFVSFLKQSCVPSIIDNDDQKTESLQHLVTVSNLQEKVQGMSLSGHVRNIDAHGKSPALLDLPKNDKNLKKNQKDFFDSSLCNEENFDGSLFPCPEITTHVPSSKNLAGQALSNSCAKRKLVLDGVTEFYSGRAQRMKENIPPKEPLSTVLARSSWKYSAGKPFACGRCKEAFSCNALLLDHVSKRHHGPLRLLQPLYTCGLCTASFYKNSFLVRHCYQHHTPR